MLDERRKKKKSQVVVGGDSSHGVEGSGAAPDFGVSPYDQFPLIPPLCCESWRCEKTRGRRGHRS